MFGKLLKYEFKSLGKWYLSLYAIIGLLSLVIGFWVRTITYRAEHNSRFVEHGPATAEAWLLGITVFASSSAAFIKISMVDKATSL